MCGDKQQVLTEWSLVEEPLQKPGFDDEALEAAVLIEEESRGWDRPQGSRDLLSPSTRMMMNTHSPPSPSNTSVQANPLATQAEELDVGVEPNAAASGAPQGPVREDDI